MAGTIRSGLDWFFSIAQTGSSLTGLKLQNGFGPKLPGTFSEDPPIFVRRSLADSQGSSQRVKLRQCHLTLVQPSSIDRVIKKVASAPKQSKAIAMSEADERAGALSRYFQARPTKASPKHLDARKMTLRAWSAYSRPAAPQKTRSAPKPHNRDMPANITETGLGHNTKKAAANPTERSTSPEELTNCLETIDTSNLFRSPVSKV
jgi:hypothetical protein